MAVTKIWQVKGSLADVVKYAGNPEKTRTMILHGSPDTRRTSTKRLTKTSNFTP